MWRIGLSLGSNEGDSLGILRGAVGRLMDVALNETTVSAAYRTKPMGDMNQPDFVNLAVLGRTGLTCWEFLDFVAGLEKWAGRVRNSERPKGPRTLDVDIIFFGSLQIETAVLTLPHPRFRERAFVLRPLLDLDPSLRDPVSGFSFSGFLAKLPDQGVYLFQEKL